MEKGIVSLNEDVMGVIFSKLEYIQICELGITCKAFAAILRKYHKKNTYYITDDIKLKPMQALLRKEFVGKTREDIELEASLAKERGEKYSYKVEYGKTPGYCCMSFRAQMGFGKTIAGFACCQDFTLIVATNNTVKIWLEESKKLGWYSPNPKKSLVLFYNSKYRKHYEYIKALRNKSIDSSEVNPDEMIIVTFDKNASDILDILHNYRPQGATLIVDEAHIERKEIQGLQSYCKWNGGDIFDRELLLSASSMNENRIGLRVGSIHRKVRISAMEECPEAIWEIRPGEYSLHTLKRTIEKIITDHYKTVIVITNNMIDNLLESEGVNKIEDLFDLRKTKIFHLKSGSTTVTKFNSYGSNAALFINTNQNEGLTVEADAMIIISPENMNVNRGVQTVGRTIRPCNPYQQATIYMLCGKEQEIRCSYIRYFFDERFDWDYETFPKDEYLVKCNSLASILGSNHNELSSIDGCIIFHDYHKTKIDSNVLVEWWNKHKYDDTVLTEKIIRQLSITN